MKYLLYPALFLLTGLHFAISQDAELRGQASAWLQAGKDSRQNAALGMRYIPEFKWGEELAAEILFDIQLSVNIFGSQHLCAASHPQHYSAIKPYRAWLRCSGEQFELRLGLQKINFGPARLLRSLRWFDRVDPRDPLQITDGIYGLLARYYFLNNANIWLWGLYGNQEIKGMEFLAAGRKSPEWGGRVQYPVPHGETGISFHHREARETLSKGAIHLSPENRFAFDGNWDLGVALWFEAVIIKNEYAQLQNPWQKYVTLGGDYTFDWDNGFHATAEHLIAGRSEKPERWPKRYDFSALMFDYGLNLTDRINLVVFYNYRDKDFYAYSGWQRTWDNWMVNLSAFWNPLQAELFENRQTLLAGKGLQIMLVFNH